MDASTQEFVVTVTKAITPVLTAGLVPLFKPLFDRSIRRRSKAVEALEFISGFLAFDIRSRNRLVVEQTFAAYFRHRYDYDEIVALLSFTNPTKAFTLLKDSRAIVELKPSGSFAFREKFATRANRKKRRIAYFGYYAASVYAALLPVMFSDEVAKQLGFTFVVPLTLWLLTFFSFAIAALSEGTSVRSAENFIEEQSKKT